MRTCALLAVTIALAAPSLASSPQQPPRIVLLDDTAELDAALAARTAPHDIPVRLAAFSLPDDDPAKTRVLVVAELSDPGGSGSLASVACAVRNDRGQQLAYLFRRLELRRTADGTLAYAGILTVPPGTYRLRLAALRNSRVGAADVPLTARLQAAASVQVGDLLVGDTPGELAATNVSVGRRVRSDRLVITVPLGLTGDLPAGFLLTVDVAKDKSGAAIVSAPAIVARGSGRARLAQAVVDARAIPDGDYAARLRISAAGREVSSVSTPFVLDRGATRAGGPAVAMSMAPRFSPEEVLDAAVLSPFLDDLAARAPERSRPAIDQAKAGRFEDAARALTANDPNDPAGPFIRGLTLFSQGQLQAASDAFRETLRAAPDFFVGAFYIGACYAAGGRDQQAVNAWQTSLVGLEQYPIVFRLLGEAMSRIGQPERAVDILDEAVSHWPDDRAMRLRLAKAALEARRYDLVTQCVEAGASRQPADAELLLVGMQAIFERATQSADAPPDDSLARLRRYRDAYVAAGGSQTTLVAEWVAAVEKKASAGKSGL